MTVLLEQPLALAGSDNNLVNKLPAVVGLQDEGAERREKMKTNFSAGSWGVLILPRSLVMLCK